MKKRIFFGKTLSLPDLTDKEMDKEQQKEILYKNQEVVRKIEYYQRSRWRRIKFWFKAKRTALVRWWKGESKPECRNILLKIKK
jgi:hypothetical protein